MCYNSSVKTSIVKPDSNTPAEKRAGKQTNKRLKMYSDRIFTLDGLTWVIPVRLNKDPLKQWYKMVILFMLAARKQFWVLFGAWCICILMLGFGWVGYAFLIVPILFIALATTMVIECRKILEAQV